VPEKIAYIYSELPNYIRVKKNIFMFSEMFKKVKYIGVNRTGKVIDKQDYPENINFSIYQKPIAFGGFKSVFQSIGFARFVISELKKEEFDVVIFANEELLWITSLLDYKPKVICEILDSLAIRTFGALSFFNPLFNIYCEYYYKKCDALIEVSKHRKEFRSYYHKNVFVIPNSPVTTNFDLNLFPELDSIEYIYVSGSVTPNLSGIEELLQVFDSNDLGNLKIVYSGRLKGEWADRTLFSKSYVINLGDLMPEESLVVARKSIAMFAYYKPVNLNFRLASPNKVADALLVCRPILMNSECEAKLLIEEAGLSLTSAYSNLKGLAENIRKLTYKKVKASDIQASKVYNQYFSEEIIKANWNKVLSKDGK